MLPPPLMKIVCSIVCAVSALAFAGSLSAQEADRTFDTPDVTIEWQFGLAGKIYGSDREDIRQGFANHVSFLITNHRDSVLEGVIDVGIRLQQMKMAKPAHEPVDIGPGSTKRFSFYLETSNDGGRPWGGWNTPSFAAQGGEVEVSLNEASSGRLLWRRSEGYAVEEMMYASPLRCLVIGKSNRVPMYRVALPSPGNQQGPIGLGDRSIEFKEIAPWQSPDHFPCLAPFNAVVLSPDIEPDALTVAQQRALAEYVVNSGILVLPTETVDSWRESIFTDTRRLPFALKETTTTDLFLYGNGKVFALKMPAVGNPDAASERQLYDLIDTHPHPPLALTENPERWSSDLGINATKSAMTVAGFLGLYGVISIACLYFFRRIRRPALIRAVIVMIALFSVGSVGMGLYLRVIPGDVEWSTLTEACVGGGAIQHGKFHFISAGNRNQTFEVTPAETLLQPSRPLPYWYGYDNTQQAWRRETLQLDGSEAYGSANIPILPWGHAHWKSRLYIGDIQPIQVTVQLPDRRQDEAKVTVTNPNTFSISAASITIQRSSDSASLNIGKKDRGTFVVAPLGSIPPMKTITVEVMLSTNSGSPYAQPLPGQIFGYLSGNLSESPGIGITPGKGFDESNIYQGDFRHSFQQRLDTTGLPTDQELVDFLNTSTNIPPTPANPGGFILLQ
ncbi:MAG: hypothetical protein KDN22_10210 [Verrucomicrobiae bacterium]|nr:hypothetical protein [Verrucomicrobiae bacterium]